MGADRTTYSDLSFEPIERGIVTSHTETWSRSVRIAMTASVAPDGTTVLLNVGAGDYAMSSKAARELAVALISAAADVEGGAPLPAGHQQLADFAADAIRDSAAVAREGR